MFHSYFMLNIFYRLYTLLSQSLKTGRFLPSKIFQVKLQLNNFIHFHMLKHKSDNIGEGDILHSIISNSLQLFSMISDTNEETGSCAPLQAVQ